MGPASVGPLSDCMTSWALDTAPRVRGSVWSFVELKFVLESGSRVSFLLYHDVKYVPWRAEVVCCH